VPVGLEVLLWFVFMASIAAGIAAIVHLVTRVRPAPWVIVAAVVAFLLIPVVSIVVYWSVYAVNRFGRKPRTEEARPPAA
jgi:hypothetical protein